jgi:hypothetical protein
MKGEARAFPEGLQLVPRRPRDGRNSRGHGCTTSGCSFRAESTYLNTNDPTKVAPVVAMVQSSQRTEKSLCTNRILRPWHSCPLGRCTIWPFSESSTLRVKTKGFPGYRAGETFILGGGFSNRRRAKRFSRMKSQFEKPLHQGRSPRATWPLRRNNCEFSLRSFCVVGSEMMGSDGL